MVCPYYILGDEEMYGLKDEEVIESRKKYGNNDIGVGKSEGFFSLFLDSLGDPIIRILLIALGIKIVFLMSDFDWYETVGIVIAIILSSFISTISEYGSSRAFERLMNESSKIQCTVKRNGKRCKINICEIVVGDLLILSSGDKIGADGIVVDGSLEVDESSMNGEMSSVKKGVKDIVYRGCVVYHGNAIVRVDKVGANTYYGRLVEELGESSGVSPLKERLGRLAIVLSKIGYFSAFLVSVSYLFERIVISNSFDIAMIWNTISDIPLLFAYFLHALTLSVTIIAVSVPEGLPMMVTLVLSSNMKKMLNNNVLVRKMVGIETAGSLNILFTDKTGTLTKGKLDVDRILLGNGKEVDNFRFTSPRYQEIFSESLFYNNESFFDDSSHEVVGGNITDRAIMSYIGNISRDDVSIVSHELFDSKRKYSSVIFKKRDKYFKCIKGAPEVILNKCDRYLNEDGFKQLFLHKEKIEEKIKIAGNLGIRVLCVAYEESNFNNFKDCYILVGLLFIRDEIRDESIEGVKLIQNAGIQVVMVTGDYEATAVAVAREVGIISSKNDVVLTSDKFNSMSDDEVKNILKDLKVVSRALPSDKSRLVRLSREMNFVVGMTGDGVNDAIALKKADVGFAMGSGTEVAKEASDIVILDDNILSIEKAILYGRTIFKSIRKFIIFQLTVNFCAIGISIIGPFIGIQSPVTVIQMLWINMVMDTLAGFAFSYEPPLMEYMEEAPKKRSESIINSYMLQEIIVMSIYSSILCIFFLKSNFVRGLFRYSVSNRYLLTAFFGLFIFVSIFNSFNARTIRLNILQDIFKNKVFLIIIIFIVLVQVVMIYYGGNLFRTSGLTYSEFVVMFMFAFSVIPVDFFRKLISKKIGISFEI